MKICPKCAAENNDTAKYCNECGASLEIKETETPETVNDTEPVSETPKEDTTPVENEESTPVTAAETVTDGQESATEQTETKEEPAPKKKNRLIIGIVAAVLICIIGFMATRPRLKSLEVTYSGDTANGVVLDNDNEGFTVVAVYSDGRKENVPQGEWQIAEPETLESDGSKDITITYKNVSQNINVICSSTRLQYLTATYNGSTYEGTVINGNSDITVTGHYKKEGFTQNFTDGWYLDPVSVTLKAGKTSKIAVKINGDDGNTYSADLEITGTEKPFTNPKIEGDHYNCSSEQLVKYLNDHTQFTIEPTDTAYFGDEYTTYIITPPATSSFTHTGLGLRENEDGKVCIIALLSTQVTDGIAESLWLAEYFDDTVEEKTNDASLALFLKGSVFATDKTIIIKNENISDKGQVFFIMPREYSDNNALDEFLKK